MKVAIIHDYLREYGGAERVLEAIHGIWPQAPVYTSFIDWKSLGEHARRFEAWNIKTSWVQHNPLVKKFHSPLRFLAPTIWAGFDLSAFDTVISSSGWFICRGVTVKKPAVHFCYIHHPPRNLYGYATGSSLQKYWPVRLYTTIVNFFLRHYYFETAQKVDYFIANSKETARRVEKFYRRDSTVIYPPIEISKLKSQHTNPKKDYYLSVGRLTYSKRIDLAILACNKLKLPLKVVGSGKEELYLKSLAGPTIEFLGAVSDSELYMLYRRAKALIFCALDEDFGMVPVEAMTAGTPVVALGQGGVLETVIDGKNGVLFKDPTVESMIGAIKTFEKTKKDWTVGCITQAKKFSKERFTKEMVEFIKKHSSLTGVTAS
jgi:glycosyltransferase involved in cell wall biosynthesis